jgi:pentose-5-phosphate-3-epimerase
MKYLKTFEALTFRGQKFVPATEEKVREIAPKVAKAFSIVDGKEVFPEFIEEGSFELNIDGEQYAASLDVLDNEIRLVSVPGTYLVGYYDDDVETMVNNIKNFDY